MFIDIGGLFNNDETSKADGMVFTSIGFMWDVIIQFNISQFYLDVIQALKTMLI